MYKRVPFQRIYKEAKLLNISSMKVEFSASSWITCFGQSFGVHIR